MVFVEVPSAVVAVVDCAGLADWVCRVGVIEVTLASLAGVVSVQSSRGEERIVNTFFFRKTVSVFESVFNLGSQVSVVLAACAYLKSVNASEVAVSTVRNGSTVLT